MASEPVILTGLSTTNMFGGFIMELVGFANIAKHFPGPNRLNLIYNAGASYKATLTELCPQIDRAFGLQQVDLSIQALSRKGVKGLLKKNRLPPDAIDALQAGLQNSWMLLTPNIRWPAYNLVQPWTRFRIPQAQDAALEAQLIAAGVSPDRFLVAMHFREGAHHGDEANIRNVDPAGYVQVAQHIIRAQGGQVVRLGDKSSSALPEMDGLVDLSRLPNALMLQAYAMSRARYAYCAHSGLMHLAMAFQTPLASADAVNDSALAFYPEAVCLTKTYVSPEGRRFRQRDAYEAGLLDLKPDTLPEGYAIVDCAPSDLVKLADRLFDMTSGVAGWRTPVEIPARTPNPHLFGMMTGKTKGVHDEAAFL